MEPVGKEDPQPAAGVSRDGGRLRGRSAGVLVCFYLIGGVMAPQRPAPQDTFQVGCWGWKTRGSPVWVTAQKVSNTTSSSGT